MTCASIPDDVPSQSRAYLNRPGSVLSFVVQIYHDGMKENQLEDTIAFIDKCHDVRMAFRHPSRIGEPSPGQQRQSATHSEIEVNSRRLVMRAVSQELCLVESFRCARIMILHDDQHVRSQLLATLGSAQCSQSDRRVAQKGLDIISCLLEIDGPEKWIHGGGHLVYGIAHAPLVESLHQRRVLCQVVIDTRNPLMFCEVQYLLPHEQRPWEYVSGFARSSAEASRMIMESLMRCEQRDEYLYESLLTTNA